MNRNEISELRRRLNPEKNNIPEILGCYVDTKGEIISSFRRPLISMPQEECEKYLNIFRKTLSGTPGKNLIDVEFDPYDVMNSENHKALMHLRETGLKDEEAVQDLFARRKGDPWRSGCCHRGKTECGRGGCEDADPGYR